MYQYVHILYALIYTYITCIGKNKNMFSGQLPPFFPENAQFDGLIEEEVKFSGHLQGPVAPWLPPKLPRFLGQTLGFQFYLDGLYMLILNSNILVQLFIQMVYTWNQMVLIHSPCDSGECSETPAAPLHGHSTGRALGCHRQWPRSVVMSNGAGNDQSQDDSKHLHQVRDTNKNGKYYKYSVFRNIAEW